MGTDQSKTTYRQTYLHRQQLLVILWEQSSIHQILIFHYRYIYINRSDNTYLEIDITGELNTFGKSSFCIPILQNPSL